jgi:hypothetical protein
LHEDLLELIIVILVLIYVTEGLLWSDALERNAVTSL